MGSERKERRRRQLMEAARRVFAEKGYVAATVEDIVAEVEVARGTFYLYFGDKLDVFRALVEDFFARVSAAIVSIDLQSERSPRQQLEDNLLRVLKVARGEPELVGIALATASGVDAGLDAELKRFWGDLRQFIDETLDTGQRIGLVRPGERRAMVSMALGGFKELLLDDQGGPSSDEAMAKEVLAFLESGLLIRSR